MTPVLAIRPLSVRIKNAFVASRNRQSSFPQIPKKLVAKLHRLIQRFNKLAKMSCCHAQGSWRVMKEIYFGPRKSY